MANAIAAAKAAFEADAAVQGLPPGTPARRERMREIIHAIAATWGVERADLTIALTYASVRRG
ncbi:conserved protein of unknown function [Rhodovastum atsumiense]|nr:conserved protein of unknown function [Rhodovastum atsumiense]